MTPVSSSLNVSPGLKPFELIQRQLTLLQDLITDDIKDVRLCMSQYPVAWEKLKSLHVHLAQYMVLQNDEFYRQLKASYEGQRSPCNIISFFAQDFNALRVKLFIFGEKYLGDLYLQHEKSFAKDFEAITEEIRLRFQMEEAQLFGLLMRAPKA